MRRATIWMFLVLLVGSISPAFALVSVDGALGEWGVNTWSDANGIHLRYDLFLCLFVF